MPKKSKSYLPEHFSNRELSWLEFNQRVLEEALDPKTPLLERVKFLCIVSSNLDEFFEIRVAGIKQQIETRTNDPGPDGLSAIEAFDSIHGRAARMVRDQYQLWNKELVPALAKEDIRFLKMEELDPEDREWAARHFHQEVFPVLTPLAIDPSHPFPQLLNKSLNLIVVLERKDAEHEPHYAIVQVPRVLNRLIALPNREPHKYDFIFLSRLIEEHVHNLFPGIKVLGAYPFRVTRNSDLYIDEEEAQNLLRLIEEELRKRNRGNAVRLELEQNCPLSVRSYLLEKFQLKKEDLYAVEGPLNLLRLMPVCSLNTAPALKYKPFTPVVPLSLQGETSIFDIMRNQDVLMHHPYESFSTVVDFLQRAATDPRVLAIKMTLYRTSGDSPIVKALIDAAQAGKQVTALVELRARFDEANNIAWARRMEEAGIHVVYGLVGLKTHCKVLVVVRRDEDHIRHYVHLGTGNYHSKTARLYTDLGLLTTREALTREVAALFNTLTGMSEEPGFKNLMVAPFGLRERFLEKIKREISHAKAGRSGYIFAKMNSLVDEEIIASLYDASCAGVKIQLIIRGICCLRPGIPGVSENIEVRSIVDQFLEHSRIFYFGNNGEPEVYLGSADWMPRNLVRRVETVFPILDARLRDRIINEIISVFLKDTIKTRLLLPDGTHEKPHAPQGKGAVRSQEEFMKAAEQTQIPQVAKPVSPALVPQPTPASAKA